MAYDINSNPRALIPDPEQLKQNGEVIDELQARLDECHAVVGMFNSRGWKTIEAQLQGELQRAERSLRDPKTSDPALFQFVKGQVMAFEKLIGMGDIYRQRRTSLADQLKATEQ